MHTDDEFQPASACPQPLSASWPLFTWSPECSVGIGILDQQHRAIFDRLNRLYDAMLQQQGRAALASILDETIGYIAQHFAGEELLMQAFEYPELPEHQQEHQRLMRVLCEFQHQFADDREHLVEPLLEFMEGWLIRHILTTDQRYAAFFAERGARP